MNEWMHPEADHEERLASFFQGDVQARLLFDAIQARISSLGACKVVVSKTQVAFRRRIGFAWVWIPGRALRRPAAPLVLSVALRRRDASLRWKSVVEPVPGRFMHHLEVFAEKIIDDEVLTWLKEAYDCAV